MQNIQIKCEECGLLLCNGPDCSTGFGSCHNLACDMYVIHPDPADIEADKINKAYDKYREA